MGQGVAPGVVAVRVAGAVPCFLNTVGGHGLSGSVLVTVEHPRRTTNPHLEHGFYLGRLHDYESLGGFVMGALHQDNARVTWGVATDVEARRPLHNAPRVGV